MPDTATETEETHAAETQDTGGGSVVQCRADGQVSAVMSAEDKEGTHFEASVRTGGWAFKEDEKHRKVRRLRSLQTNRYSVPGASRPRTCNLN